MKMTDDSSMINKNTSEMTNSNDTLTNYVDGNSSEKMDTVFGPWLNQNSFLLMETEAHFNHGEIPYMSADHYMIAEMAFIMGDNDMANVIRDTRTISSLITLEDRIINVNDIDFQDVKTDLFFKANYYKFLYNTTQRDKLLATGSNTILHVKEILSADKLENQMGYLDRDTIGGNCLGRILMEIRDTIKERMSSADLV